MICGKNGKPCLSAAWTKSKNLKSKRIRNKRSPWIKSELLLRMCRRDVLKKKAISTNVHAMWQQFKRARNQVNNATKLAKKTIFF